MPGDTREFKRLLLKRGAVIQEHYADGRTKERQWDASGMRDTSSVSGNLRSKSWYKGGAWLTSGINKIVVKIIGYDT